MALQKLEASQGPAGRRGQLMYSTSQMALRPLSLEVGFGSVGPAGWAGCVLASTGVSSFRLPRCRSGPTRVSGGVCWQRVLSLRQRDARRSSSRHSAVHLFLFTTGVLRTVLDAKLET